MVNRLTRYFAESKRDPRVLVRTINPRMQFDPCGNYPLVYCCKCGSRATWSPIAGSPHVTPECPRCDNRAA